MTSPLSSAQAARSALATRLRHLRLDAGLAGHQLSLACGWHPAKTSRIENTRALPSDADIRAWCAACGAGGQAEDLIAAARSATSMYVEWKRLNRAGLANLQQEIVPLVERTRAFRVYCSHVVPGLLQTPAYAAAVIAAYGTFHRAAGDVEAAAAARVKRSGVLHKRGRRFAFLIEESVLHSRIADPDTTGAQLEHLIEVAGLPQVSLGIVAARAPRPSMESFTVYDDVQVGIELLSARVTITAPGEIATYERAFADLAAHAVHGAGACTLIRRAAAAHG
ncbi:Scr1 family TA system antitoxin-like transcriptional regulator [Streptomyces virginiae]|uniref:Scr1 family TA system antitoxin-like transcriptional regulator n=1 Tax=Streptomyces virginiae TaxID=1961 RepID=UPI00225890C3|nr:Scr1 family TA system antitoxin-like transcriptional regulator [Streptomyces virginiae]MCX5174012.1 helix-turn-helix domain-containing protein [Streptomyces virginiae]